MYLSLHLIIFLLMHIAQVAGTINVYLFIIHLFYLFIRVY